MNYAIGLEGLILLAAFGVFAVGLDWNAKRKGGKIEARRN